MFAAIKTGLTFGAGWCWSVLKVRPVPTSDMGLSYDIDWLFAAIKTGLTFGAGWCWSVPKVRPLPTSDMELYYDID